MNSEQGSYDVLIIGGSMVGAALAAALGGSPLRVGVVEARRAEPLDLHDDYELRVSAITRASQRIFESLGAWQAMQAQRVNPYQEMHVWDAAGSGVVHFDCAEVGEENLGHIIENRVIQSSLLACCDDFENIQMISPAQMESFENGSAGVRVTLQDGRVLHTQMLVGADGRDSRVRELSGIKTRGWNYDQTAVVATVKPELHHQDTAWQLFLPEGPLAFLPLPDGYCSIVWTVTHDHARQLLELDEGMFRQQLAQAFDHTLGAIEQVGSRASFPLRLQHAYAYVQPRLALLGDAAHAIHPLAGQGVNLGLLDAAVLAEVLLDAQQQGKETGSLAVLRRYERWRKGDNLGMMFAMDGFKRLFGSQLGPVKTVRNLGLGLANAVAPAKQMMIRHAMGLAGELPRLAHRVSRLS